LPDDDYEGQVSFTSNGGTANLTVRMEVNSSTSGSSGIVVPSGLRAYYTFEDGAPRDEMDNFRAVSFGATASDDSPNEGGKSFAFDGIDDFLQLAGNPLRNTNSRTIHGTISCWVKTSSNGTVFSIPIINDDQENEFLLGFQNEKIRHSFLNHKDRCCGGNSWGEFSTNFSTILLDDTWHHLIATYDGSTERVSLFVDGVLISQEGYKILGRLNAEISRIGKDYYEGTQDFGVQNFSGLLDNIRIYNRPLSSSEVEEIFDARQ